MKNILFILALIMSIGVFSQDYTVTQNRNTPLQINTNDTLASAEADTVDILITKGNDQKLLGYTIQTISANVSGTSEGYTDLYESLDGTNWESLGARVSADTLNSSNLINIKRDADGFDARYLRLIITNKTQTQSTAYNSYLYIYRN